MRKSYTRLAIGLISSALIVQAPVASSVYAAAAPTAAPAPMPAAAPAPAAAPTCQPLRKIATMDMQPLPDGRVKVPVTLVDRPAMLLFDTGSPFRTLRPETVTALGMTPVTGGDVVKGIPGQENAKNVMLSSVTLGNFKIPDAAFLISPPGKADAPIDGLLTLDMLVDFDVDLDFVGNKLNMFLQDHCKGRVVYWPSNGLAVVPFFFDATNRINFPVKVDGTPMVAVLDTSAANTSLDLDAAKASGAQIATDNMTKTGEVKNGKDVYQRRFKGVSFEDITIANTTINVLQGGKPAKPAAKGEQPAPTPPVVIGMNILKKLHVYVALQERTLYITPGAVPTAATPAPAQ